MDTTTQMEWVTSQLKNNGSVTRNQALQKYITRLAARINDLRCSGWEIEGKKEGGDYIYQLVIE